jgi:hypothetical protein
MAGPAGAEVNEVTPSTNDANKAAENAYFEAVPATDSVTLTFISPDPYLSCFEYRADDEAPTEEGANWNPLVLDGLWDFVCVSSTAPAEPVKVIATDYVDVRMVFGAETTERFDWTRVETLEPEEETEPVEPTRPETVAECKQGGWKALNYTNQGRCVSDVRKFNNQERQKAKKDAQVAKKAAKATAKGAKATKVKGKKK